MSDAVTADEMIRELEDAHSHLMNDVETPSPFALRAIERALDYVVHTEAQGYRIDTLERIALEREKELADVRRRADGQADHIEFLEAEVQRLNVELHRRPLRVDQHRPKKFDPCSSLLDRIGGAGFSVGGSPGWRGLPSQRRP